MSKQYGYMCLVDHAHEFDECEVMIYPTIERLKAKRVCVKQCGIVRVELANATVIQQSDYSSAIKKARAVRIDISDVQPDELKGLPED